MNIGGYGELVFLFVMLLIDVVVDMFDGIVMIVFDVNFMLCNVNLLVFLLIVNWVVVNGSVVYVIDLVSVFDCSKVFVDFLGID